ncbi:LytTR family transcriptional regulator DNA-binding domain-containing protein [Chryseobacterium sp. CBSDS_008]|uniref:LytTR family transcriptional regulator DNA-binding domain-containing protein n=1 Tax=Chryseobacterium sp. CBSDS_008 TaxID=3415265 RepID=UPI003CF57EC9
MVNQLSENFVRIHKSFIVNLDKVQNSRMKKVILPIKFLLSLLDKLRRVFSEDLY